MNRSINVARSLRCALLMVAGALSGCASPPTVPREWSEPPVFGAQDSVFTDDDVLAAAYSPYRWPPGFYEEPMTGGLTPYYVNTVSIKPVCCRPDHDWRELATEDTAQARAWADSSVAYSNGVVPLEDGPPIVTRRYFEFPTTGVRPGTPVPMRVHRLSYIDRSMYNRFRPDSIIGQLNERPVDLATARGVAEYLWYQGNRDIGGASVLSSFGRDEGDAIHHMLYVTVVSYGDYGLCDHVSLLRLDYRVFKATGLIEYKISAVRQIVGRCH